MTGTVPPETSALALTRSSSACGAAGAAAGRMFMPSEAMGDSDGTPCLRTLMIAAKAGAEGNQVNDEDSARAKKRFKIRESTTWFIFMAPS